MSAQSTRGKRAYGGVDKLRKLLRKFDPETVQDLKDTMKSGATRIERSMRSGAPVDQGDLQESISHKIGRDGMTAYIGPGADRASIAKLGFGMAKQTRTKTGRLTSATIKNNNARWQLYKANWVEFGTKGGGGVPAQNARPFINPAFDSHKDKLLSELNDGISKALKKAAASE